MYTCIYIQNVIRHIYIYIAYIAFIYSCGLLDHQPRVSDCWPWIQADAWEKEAREQSRKFKAQFWCLRKALFWCQLHAGPVLTHEVHVVNVGAQVNLIMSCLMFFGQMRDFCDFFWCFCLHSF